LGVVVLGDEAAIATAPQVPAIAIATAADTVRSIRLGFSNPSPFSGVPEARMIAPRHEEGLRAR